MNDEFIAPSDPIPEQRISKEYADVLRQVRPFIQPAVNNMENVVNSLSMIECEESDDCPTCYLMGQAFKLMEELGKFGIDFDAILERAEE